MDTPITFAGMLAVAASGLRGEEGATATEYAVMLALILLACLAAIGSLGLRVNNIFSSSVEQIPGEF